MLFFKRVFIRFILVLAVIIITSIVLTKVANEYFGVTISKDDLSATIDQIPFLDVAIKISDKIVFNNRNNSLNSIFEEEFKINKLGIDFLKLLLISFLSYPITKSIFFLFRILGGYSYWAERIGSKNKYIITKILKKFTDGVFSLFLSIYCVYISTLIIVVAIDSSVIKIKIINIVDSLEIKVNMIKNEINMYNSVDVYGSKSYISLYDIVLNYIYKQVYIYWKTLQYSFLSLQYLLLSFLRSFLLFLLFFGFVLFVLYIAKRSFASFSLRFFLSYVLKEVLKSFFSSLCTILILGFIINIFSNQDKIEQTLLSIITILIVLAGIQILIDSVFKRTIKP